MDRNMIKAAYATFAKATNEIVEQRKHLHERALHSHLINMKRLIMTLITVGDLFENLGVGGGIK
jgi:hypothetical protein